MDLLDDPLAGISGMIFAVVFVVLLDNILGKLRKHPDERRDDDAEPR